MRRVRIRAPRSRRVPRSRQAQRDHQAQPERRRLQHRQHPVLQRPPIRKPPPSISPSHPEADWYPLQAGAPGISVILGLLGIKVGDVNAIVGFGCAPLTVGGAGAGASCAAQPVCCTGNSFVSAPVRPCV